MHTSYFKKIFVKLRTYSKAEKFEKVCQECETNTNLYRPRSICIGLQTDTE